MELVNWVPTLAETVWDPFALIFLRKTGFLISFLSTNPECFYFNENWSCN